MSAVIIYASTTGNTAAVAEYMANRLGCEAVPVKDAGSVDLGQLELVVFGTRVHAGSPSKDIEEYIGSHSGDLAGKRTALFLCGMIKGKNGEDQLEKISSDLGIPTSAYFIKGKRVVKESASEIDAFLEALKG
ncbi:MAG: hypothetical protein GX583_03585 [Thermoplasmatales archaeon]|nr:hypothetical protein [Thermoplasmatales archaeon]